MSMIEYRVGSGDTFSAIARRHNVSVDVLAQVNSLSDIHRIWPGQVLKIPKEAPSRSPSSSRTVTYRVRAGDTLSDIAARNKVTVDALVLVNHLENPDRIVLGQVLTIPKEPSSTTQVRAKDTQATGTRNPGTQEPKSKEPGSKIFEEGLLAKGNEIASFGRVNNDEGVNLRAAPGGAILKRLPFNTRVFVSHKLSGEWYFVTLDDGSFGREGSPVPPLA